MTSNYQEIHNLKQEVKRLRHDMLGQRILFEKEIKALKIEIVKPKTDINKEPNQWSEVLRAICEVMDMTPDTIITKCRKRKPMYARHMFNHICRKRLGMTFTEIGMICGLDHSTIISSVREFGDIIAHDKEVQRHHAKVNTILHERFA